MKKLFYFATVIMMLSVSLFSCSDDDDPDVLRNITISNLGSENNPASWGKEIVIEGTGFSEAADFYLCPAGTTFSISNAVKLAATKTSTSLRFVAPFQPLGGGFDIYQVESADICKVTTVYYHKQKYPHKLTKSNEFGRTDHTIEYDDRGNLKSIEKISFSINPETGSLIRNFTSTTSYTFDTGNNLTEVRTETVAANGDRFTGDIYKFTYGNPANVNMVYTQGVSGIPHTSALTLDDKGLLTKRVEKWTEILYGWNEETEETIEKPTYFRIDYAYTYDAKYNMTKCTRQKYNETEDVQDGGETYSEYTFTGNPTFFPKTALPIWYWSIFTNQEPFLSEIAYNNTLATITVLPEPSLWAPNPKPVTSKMHYDYDKDGYPTAVYSVLELPGGGTENSLTFNVEYKNK